MPVRLIDANKLQELCNRRIQDTWNNGTAPVSWAHAYADFKDDIDSVPTLTTPNEPLTLEQLREMGGEPVWLDDEKTWALLQVWDDDNIDAVFPMPIGCFHAESVIGKKIYRRPPEEVEKT